MAELICTNGKGEFRLKLISLSEFETKSDPDTIGFNIVHTNGEASELFYSTGSFLIPRRGIQRTMSSETRDNLDFLRSNLCTDKKWTEVPNVVGVISKLAKKPRNAEPWREVGVIYNPTETIIPTGRAVPYLLVLEFLEQGKRCAVDPHLYTFIREVTAWTSMAINVEVGSPCISFFREVDGREILVALLMTVKFSSLEFLESEDSLEEVSIF